MAGNDPRLTEPGYRRLRLLVLARDGERCQIKGPTCTQAATVVDHVIARADGGDMYDPANLRAACRACNNRGGAEIANRRMARYRTTVANPASRW
jgi:5-methylcytosine-specific restriction endonuclease McrA